MFAWISRYNGAIHELGTANNTTATGTKEEIIELALEYGKGFNTTMISFHCNEERKYGNPDEIKLIFGVLE